MLRKTTFIVFLLTSGLLGQAPTIVSLSPDRNALSSAKGREGAVSEEPHPHPSRRRRGSPPSVREGLGVDATASRTREARREGYTSCKMQIVKFSNTQIQIFYTF